MHPAIIRARQIRALYQRELTALNRNPHVSTETRNELTERLWQQANEQIGRLRGTVERDLTTFTDDERSLFTAPRRPTHLDSSE